MKVMYVVFEAKLGGHVLSAFTVANEMKARGHEVLFVGKKGRLTPRIETEMPFVDLEIPIFHGSRQTYFTRRSWAAVGRLRRLIRERHVDLVHAFDAGSYMHCYLACLLEQRPVLCTICGGVDPYYNLPPCHRLIVFSDEQKNKMITQWHWPADRIEIIRNRLDLKYIGDEKQRLTRDELAGFGIRPDLPLIIMITSFRGLQINGIFRLIDALEIARGKNEFQMVFIGGESDEVESYAKRMDVRFGKGAVLFLKPIEDAFRFLMHASIVMGVGRCAFEGMAYGKPTIVIGDKGFAGVVEPKSVEDLAYYNFSGRNQKEPAPPELLAGVIRRLLENPAMRESMGGFGRRYVMEEFDVTIGAKRIEAIYIGMLSGGAQGSTLWRLACFARLLVPVFYDNLMHRPRSLVKKALNLVTMGRLYPRSTQAWLNSG